MDGYRFQEIYTGIQIIIWNAPSKTKAKDELSSVVRLPDSWIFLGIVDNKLFNESIKY